MLHIVLVNGFYVYPWYLNPAVAGGDGQLRLLHANVLSTNVEHERLFELIAADNPDLIVLQEVSPQWETALASIRGDFAHSYVEARDGNFGIAVLSRLPLASVSHVDSSPLGFPTLVGEVIVDDRTLRFVSTHPMIPVGKELYAARNEQLREIAGLLGSWRTSTILVGDLNTTMWDTAYRDLERATGLRNARLGHGVYPTWPTFMPFAMIPIDHVLVSNDIAVEEISTGPRIGSDHLPLVVTLRL